MGPTSIQVCPSSTLLLTSLWVPVWRRRDVRPNQSALNHPLGFHELSHMRSAQPARGQILHTLQEPYRLDPSFIITHGKKRY